MMLHKKNFGRLLAFTLAVGLLTAACQPLATPPPADTTTLAPTLAAETEAPIPTLEPTIQPEPTLAPSADDLEAVITALRAPQLRWQSVSGKAAHTQFAAEETTDEISFIFVAKGLADVSWTTAEGETFRWIKTEDSQYRVDADGTYTQYALPDFTTQLGGESTPMPGGGLGLTLEHPMAILDPTRVATLLFPAWITAGNVFNSPDLAEVTLLGETRYLGREVWVLRQTKAERVIEAYVDKETAVILRLEQATAGEPKHLWQVTEIAFDEELPAGAFELPAGANPATPKLVAEAPAAPAYSDTTDLTLIALRFLQNISQWKTLQGEAVITWYMPDTPTTQVYTNRFALQTPDKAWSEMIDHNDVGGSTTWISAGDEAWNCQAETLTCEQVASWKAEGADAAADEWFNPKLLMAFPSPIRDYILNPELLTDLMQGEITTLPEETVLGRLAWVINIKNGERSADLWIDHETGMVLKAVIQRDGVPQSMVEFTRLLNNAEVDPALFTLPSE